jgi:hypothetical protein
MTTWKQQASRSAVRNICNPLGHHSDSACLCAGVFGNRTQSLVQH